MRICSLIGIELGRQRQTFRSSQEAFHHFSQAQICCLTGVQSARCKDNSISYSFHQNACHNFCSGFPDHIIVIKRQRQAFGTSREACHQYPYMRILCLIGVEHARCDDNCVSISFPQNAHDCCLSLLDRFVDITRQRQSFGSSLEDFHQISQVRICCLIGVQRARCEDNYVSISFTQKLVRSAV